jgi:pathogenesis-related protein 1
MELKINKETNETLQKVIYGLVGLLAGTGGGAGGAHLHHAPQLAQAEAQVRQLQAEVQLHRLPATAPAVADLDPHPSPQMVEAVKEMNRWRATVASDPLEWSPALAASAQARAEALAVDCVLVHGPPPGAGENLYLGPSDAPGWLAANRWGGEVLAYSYKDNRCLEGRVCGHYTQLVWKDTKQVGVGVAACADGSTVWVAHYNPAGNVAGELPF